MRAKLDGRIRQHAERKPIDNNDAAGRDRRKSPQCAPCALRALGKGKPSPRLTTSTCQPSRSSSAIMRLVIGIAAGRGGEVARHRERDASHHNAASYQARATCDSDSVTRIALNSRPSRPSVPARAASASWSKMCLVRNSVVVLTPLNSGTVVEIAIVERREHRLERLMRAADIDDDAVGVERLRDERRIDNEGCAVQRLRRAEHGPAERMGDHDVVANFDSKHRLALTR